MTQGARSGNECITVSFCATEEDSRTEESIVWFEIVALLDEVAAQPALAVQRDDRFSNQASCSAAA